MVFRADDIQLFKQKALAWANNFNVSCYLDSNNFSNQYSKFETTIAAGIKDELTANNHLSAFNQLEAFYIKWSGLPMFGFFTYDLKNEIEDLSSSNADYLDFPLLYFFVPNEYIQIIGDTIEIESDDPESTFEEINRTPLIIPDNTANKIQLQSRFSKAEYISTVNQIKDHINRGDIYVTNFCQEFYADNATIDPLNTFLKLNQISPNPFAAFFKLGSKYVLCASPERFLAKRGTKLISQPIKGTARRDEDEATDESIKSTLKSHPKELQENVMIVDMVRNDLTKSAQQGSVKAEKLFEIQSFRQVHQMVSTITCQLDDHTSSIEAIKNTFPMGSMTGAPKVSAMRLMEQYERTRRGVYSGAIGYFEPYGDFDFNVVIRTILYNADKEYLSFQVGSAITYHADAEKEYEECLLKAKAILEALGQTISSLQS